MGNGNNFDIKKCSYIVQSKLSLTKQFENQGSKTVHIDYYLQMKNIIKIAFTCVLLSFSNITNADAATLTISPMFSIVDGGSGGGGYTPGGEYWHDPCLSYSKSCIWP